MRRTMLLILSASALLVVFGSTAWACTNLATMNLSSSTVQAGDTVHITGSSYKLEETGGQEIVVRWGNLDGQVLATTTADDVGNIDVKIAVPEDAEPGHHALVATQEVERDGELVPAHGTPTRISLVVGEPAAAEPPPAATSGSQTAAAVAGPDMGLIALSGLLGLVGLGLFAAGASLFMREAMQRDPVRAPVERDA